MAEIFRQGLYLFVSGLLFCIASVVLVILISGIMATDRNIRQANAVAYDANYMYSSPMNTVEGR